MKNKKGKMLFSIAFLLIVGAFLMFICGDYFKANLFGDYYQKVGEKVFFDEFAFQFTGIQKDHNKIVVEYSLFDLEKNIFKDIGDVSGKLDDKVLIVDYNVFNQDQELLQSKIDNMDGNCIFYDSKRNEYKFKDQIIFLEEVDLKSIKLNIESISYETEKDNSIKNIDILREEENITFAVKVNDSFNKKKYFDEITHEEFDIVLGGSKFRVENIDLTPIGTYVTLKTLGERRVVITEPDCELVLDGKNTIPLDGGFIEYLYKETEEDRDIDSTRLTLCFKSIFYEKYDEIVLRANDFILSKGDGRVMTIDLKEKVVIEDKDHIGLEIHEIYEDGIVQNPFGMFTIEFIGESKGIFDKIYFMDKFNKYDLSMTGEDYKGELSICDLKYMGKDIKRVNVYPTLRDRSLFQEGLTDENRYFKIRIENYPINHILGAEVKIK